MNTKIILVLFALSLCTQLAQAQEEIFGTKKGTLRIGSNQNQDPNASFAEINMHHGGSYDETFAAIRADRPSADRKGRLYFMTRNGNTMVRRMTIDEVGRVGIKQNNPSSELDVNGIVEAEEIRWGAGRRNMLTTNDNGGGALELKGNGSSFPQIDFDNGDGDKDVRIVLINENQLRIDGGVLNCSEGVEVAYMDFPAGDGSNKARFSPQNDQLLLEGSKLVCAQGAVVPAHGGADFVFEEDYTLPSLDQVAQHIEEKGHLQDIPSAAEMEADGGVDIGQLGIKLLQKVEELTLYTIEQDKELKALKEENRRLAEQLQELH